MFLADPPRCPGVVWRHGCGGDALEVVVAHGAAAHAYPVVVVVPAAVAVETSPVAAEDVALELLPPLLHGFRRESRGDEESAVKVLFVPYRSLAGLKTDNSPSRLYCDDTVGTRENCHNKQMSQ